MWSEKRKHTSKAHPRIGDVRTVRIIADVPAKVNNHTIIIKFVIATIFYVYRLKIVLQETLEQQQIHADKRWTQVVSALWKDLPHFRIGSYRHEKVTNDLPGQYGFPKEEPEVNSEEEVLMNDTEEDLDTDSGESSLKQ